MPRLTYRLLASAAAGIILGLSAGPASAEPAAAPTPADIRAAQDALHALGLPVARTGRVDEQMRRAMCAWREMSGATASRRDPSPRELAEVAAVTTLPAPLNAMVAGVNVNRRCQVLYFVRGGRYKKVMPVTTGGPGHPTRTGTFRIFRRINGWHESTGYGAMMYRPQYFSGGMALHGSISDRYVVTYPASHGCVRLLHKDVDWLYPRLGIGGLVRVYGTWKG